MIEVAICGGPNSGKTTLAGEETDVRHTDDLMHLDWSDASEAASKWFDDPGVRVVEGVATVRALRKWLARNPVGKPCERLIYLRRNHVPLSRGQRSMRKGVASVFAKIRPELSRRGVAVEMR